MLKVLPLTYFYGEFGCLNYSILAHIEELQPKIIVSTQPDYLKLMKMKCPHIIGFEKEYFNYTNRSGFGFGIKHEYLDKLHSLGYISLKDFMNLTGSRCFYHLKPIKTPLICDVGLTGEYIGVSFRNKTHEKERNLNKDAWIRILKMIRKHSDLDIIAHGMSIDTTSSDEFSEFGIKKTESIEESVNYMNRSRLFIGSMSGISQFASNCACPIIQVGDTTRHFNYDPFNKGCLAVSEPDNDFEDILVSFIK